MLLQSYSTVLYLTESGGPTLVLEQTVSSPLAQAAWLSWPRGNNLLAYPGNLLHGVIPGPPCNPLGWPVQTSDQSDVAGRDLIRSLTDQSHQWTAECLGWRLKDDPRTPGRLTECC